jgi:hypothetical protein
LFSPGKTIHWEALHHNQLEVNQKLWLE